MSYSDIAITGVIVFLVLFAAVRAGQLSPVGTGRLARRINALEAKVSDQSVKFDTMADKVQSISDAQAATHDVLNAVRRELAADAGLTQRTWSAVDRLQQFFIQDAFEARRNRERS